jgi:predicted nucleic acid-binding protein
MILVVADTSPIRYLVLIDAIAVLPKLYDRVVLPSAVVAELTHPNAPEAVKKWASAFPEWVEVKKARHIALSGILDPGEAEAIALAEEMKADSLLVDEAEGREEALRRRLPVSGTVGVLEKAAERSLIVLAHAFQRLSQTNFRIAPELLRKALERDAQRTSAKDRDNGIKP